MWLLGTQGARQRQTPLNSTGKFKEVFSWSQVDYAFPSEEVRQAAIADETFITENNLPLGIEVINTVYGQSKIAFYISTCYYLKMIIIVCRYFTRIYLFLGLPSDCRIDVQIILTL